MRSMSLKAKLIAGFGTLLLITLGLGFMAYHSISVTDEAANEVDRKTQEQFLADSVDVIALKAANAARTYLLTKDESFRQAYESAKRDYEKTMQELGSKAKSEAGKRMLAEIESKDQIYVAVVDHEVQLKREGKDKEAVNVMYTQAVPAFRSLDEATNEFVAHLIKTKEAVDKQQDDDVSSGKRNILVLCVSGLVLGIFLAFMIARSVSIAIGRMAAAIKELAANNLAIDDVEITSEDEIGKAGIALNEMKNNLRKMIESIAGTAEHVASASEEISSSAEQQSQGAATQKDQTTQVVTAMQEMSSTVLQVSENSSKASEASHKAAETARHGGDIVDQTLAKMQVIAESVRGTAGKVEELGRSSDQIGRIVGVINDIADQTNLLALNAAIEAARAGEQGRGFAVVADEVRKLAERTTASTKEIAHMIENVQKETKLAVGAMEEGTKQVEEGVQTTSKAGEALKEIILMSEQVGDMVTHIATAAAEQSSATEEINGNMEQIANLVKESAQGAEQSAKACQELSGLAFELQKMVSNFKLRDDGLAATGDGRKAKPVRESYQSEKAMAASAR